MPSDRIENTMQDFIQRESDQPYFRNTDPDIRSYTTGERPQILVREIKAIDPEKLYVNDAMKGLPDTGDVILLRGEQTLQQVVGYVRRETKPAGILEVDILTRTYPRKDAPPTWVLILGWLQAGAKHDNPVSARLTGNLN